jgi:hypothetical protein
MKSIKIYTILAALCICTASFGQDMYDALRFSTYNYEGTARSMAMGNAFTALGGDLGGITINPAASGVYRYNEFTITPSLTTAIDKSTYEGTLTQSSRTRFGLSNIGGISSFSTGRDRGLVTFNFGVVANQTANFTSRTELTGTQAVTSKLASMAYTMTEYGIDSKGLTITDDHFDNPFYNSNALWEEILAWNTSLVETFDDDYTYIGATENFDDEGNIVLGGPLTQTLFQETTGYKQDITLNLGGNISHKFYFGINFTLQSLWYDKTQVYSETAQNSSDFQTEFSRFRHRFSRTISGTGFNMKAGIIYRPIAGLRLGATISTPTWSKYIDKNSEMMESAVYNENYYADTPLNSYEFRITSPFRWSVGAAYTFGNVALVSIDYESTNYGNIRFKTDGSMYLEDIEYYNRENQAMKETFRRVNDLRIGAEIKPTQSLAIRLGYNYYDSSEENFNGQLHYASVGLGYTLKSNFFFDLAYRQQCNATEEQYWLYDTSYLPQANEPVVFAKYHDWRLLLTIGWRF